MIYLSEKLVCPQSAHRSGRQIFWQFANIFTVAKIYRLAEAGNQRAVKRMLLNGVSAGKELRMSYVKRPLEELNLLDDFLMGAVASNKEVGPEFCRIVLSTFLEKKIGEVRVIAQRTIPASTPELRGIRMDVEIVEPAEETKSRLPSMNIYDIEPHILKDGNLPRRNRFYQAKVDGRNIPSGMEDFSQLPNLYVITITPYDPFGHDYMMYTVKNQCKEVPNMMYEDGLQFIYLNPKGTKGGNSDIREMLRYFQNSQKENATSDTLKKLHGYVSKVKVLPEVEKDYMKFEEIIWYERKEADRERRLEDIRELLEDYGELPSEVMERMQKETSEKTLKKWHKLAARVKSIEEFVSSMGESS